MNAAHTVTSLAFQPGPWDEADAKLTLREPPGAPATLPIAIRRRRGYAPSLQDPRASVGLYEDEGALRWVYKPPPAQSLRRRARRAGWFGLPDPLKIFEYKDIGPNQVNEALIGLDGKLTPNQGMRRWSAGKLAPDARPKIRGRTLLLVHGTFSNSDMWFEQLGATAPGRILLQQWTNTYGANILAFDHPTLSVAPWINALDLHQALRGVAGPIDMVCHSRGGLVASWLLRLAPVQAKQVVFVGSPLRGTSLASPYRLRVALDLMANVANALAKAGAVASTVFPLAAGAAGLAKVLGKTLQLGSALPIADAAITLVPGLASQQRIANHAETERLFADQWLTLPNFHAVTSDFEPNLDEPWWKFWTRFKNLGQQAANLGADLVFPGANDLVVDTESMSVLGPKQTAPHVFALGQSKTTHHTNYFLDPKVIGHLAATLA